MRSGAILVTSKRVNHVNLNYIVQRLDKCCEINNGWYDNCPDMAICVQGYDDRCGLGDIKCPFCGVEVPQTKCCSECGQVFPKKKKKVKK